MKLAIMQPYFFPYIGYFQLMSAVDKFVFYDDVNYIKSGWINRNRLIIFGDVRYITVPISAASSFKKINDTFIRNEGDWSKNMLSAIQQSYGSAPQYRNVVNIIESVIGSHDGCISTLAKNSVIAVAEYLEMEIMFCKSSSVYENQILKSSDRVLDICRIEKATEYWNLPGGKDLYNFDTFKESGVELKFIDVHIKPYQQMTPEFEPGLSILDVLMFNEISSVKKMIALN